MKFPPFFLAERKRLSLPLLEQLIRNYLNGSQERDIKLEFDDEFDAFWDYFQEKKDIISRVSDLCWDGVYYDLDFYVIAEYIKDRTKDSQFMIISLRNQMFELANELIGIYKTFDITKVVIFNPNSYDVKGKKIEEKKSYKRKQWKYS